MTKIFHKCSLLVIAALILSVGQVFAQKTYLVAVGLTDYDKEKNSLPCSTRDAQSIASFFKKYNNSDVFVLLDGNATRDHIMRVLNNKFSQATEKDQIIFAYSGHGFDGGVTTYNMDNEPIFCSEIQEIMRKSKAKSKMMFIMSCHSGSFAKDYSRNPNNRDYRSNDSNVLLYMSSRPDESSWETPYMNNSFFFDRLLKAFNGAADANGDRKVTARELFNYVNKYVPIDSYGMQHPQMYGRFPDDLVVVNLR